MYDLYDKQLIDIITNNKEWPDLPNTALSLLELAEKTFNSGTVEGYLSSALIYHQVLEELLVVIVELSNLLIKAQLYPAQLKRAYKRKPMFGNLLEEVKNNTIEFDAKQPLIETSAKLNHHRISFVHNLAKVKEHQIKEKAIKVKELFYEARDYYMEAEEFFVMWLEDLRQNIDWEEFLDDIAMTNIDYENS